MRRVSRDHAMVIREQLCDQRTAHEAECAGDENGVERHLNVLSGKPSRPPEPRLVSQHNDDARQTRVLRAKLYTGVAGLITDRACAWRLVSVSTLW